MLRFERRRCTSRGEVADWIAPTVALPQRLQENMPYDGYTGFNYTEQNYLNTSAGEYTCETLVRPTLWQAV